MLKILKADRMRTKAIVRQACFNLVNWINEIKMDSSTIVFVSTIRTKTLDSDLSR